MNANHYQNKNNNKQHQGTMTDPTSPDDPPNSPSSSSHKNSKKQHHHQHHHNPLSRLFGGGHNKKNKKNARGDASIMVPQASNPSPSPPVEQPPVALMPPPPPVATNNNSNKNKNGPKKPVSQRLLKDEDEDDNSSSTSTKRSWLCRTKLFKGMIEDAFELVDQDGSGTIDEKELYSGLLLIHLKLGTYAGPAACKPISREKCHAVFMKMDADGSGHLDKEEFEAVMMVLFGNVMMRVAIQYACTLLIVPMIAQGLLNGMLWIIHSICTMISTLDEHNSLANSIELGLEHLWHHAISFWSAKLPTFVHTAGSVVHGWLQAIPESVWNTIPLTLLSTVLSLMLIPWSLLQIDDFFQRLAERSNNTKNNTKNKQVANNNNKAKKTQ